MRIYADNAATTKPSRAAIEAMLPYLEEEYGNPSSLYALGQRAKEALEQAREEVAAVIGADPRRPTIRRYVPPPKRGVRPGKRTLFRRPLNITRSCTRSTDWKRKASA